MLFRSIFLNFLKNSTLLSRLSILQYFLFSLLYYRLFGIHPYDSFSGDKDIVVAGQTVTVLYIFLREIENRESISFMVIDYSNKERNICLLGEK